jgi:hypothetical protein
LPILLQNPIGTSVLTGGEIPAVASVQTFVVDSGGANFLLQPSVITGSPITVTDTVTTSKWSGCQTYVITTASQTITLPAANTLPTGGCIQIQTGSVTASLAPQSGDGINNGTTGAAVTIPAHTQSIFVTTSGATGTGAFVAPLGTVQYANAAWVSGQNLVQSPVNGIVMGPRFASPRTVYGIKCMVNNAVGATAGFDIYATASGTAPASGTKLNTNSCNANTASNSEFDMLVASPQVPAGYWIYLVPTGTWSSSVGSGGAQVDFR